MNFYDNEIDKLSSAYSAAKEAVDGNEADSKASAVTPDIFWGDTVSYRRKRTGKKRFIIYLLLFLVIAASVCLMVITSIYGRGWLSNLLSTGSPNISFTLPTYERPQLEDEYYQPDGRYTAQGVAKAISPSVVSILVSENISLDASVPSGSQGSQGSGVIISEDGYIVTNAHVVDSESGKANISVVLHDERVYQAQLVGSDIKTDIAVIKIPASGLPPAQFCDSDDVSVGEEVIAIGSPAGLYGTVTKGIVSAVNRSISVSEEMKEVDCIQIDAAINHGNSGGALLNMWGQVIGITSSKLNSAVYESIGFAISTNEAKPVIESLIEYGYVKGRVRVGITFREIPPFYKDAYGFPSGGLYVVDVSDDCDISNTALAPGDYITHLGGKEVYDTETIEAALEGYKPGDVMTATVARPDADNTVIVETFEISFRLEEDLSAINGFVKE